MSDQMFGFLNVDKPPGMTSRDVVNRVQQTVRGVKVGHAGTLDPLATGVLVVALGPAVRLVSYVQRLAKTYLATFQLGHASDTEDTAGVVTRLRDAPRPTADQVVAALPAFVGTIRQRPPAFSALKVRGRRAYDLARRGEAVELAARPVQIHRLTLVRYAFPELVLDVCCGSGTYIRSLGRDLAQTLGTAAVMSALQRTAIGDFRLTEAFAPDDLTSGTVASHVLPPRLALGHLPTATLTDEEMHRIGHGLPIDNRWELAAVEVAAVDARGQLVAILVAHRSRHAASADRVQDAPAASADRPQPAAQLRPLRNFPRALA